MQNRPTYYEAIAEITRRLCALKFEGEYAHAQQAGAFACLAEVANYSSELIAGVLERMKLTVEDLDAMKAAEENDDQPTDAEVDASDAADYAAWAKQCGR